MQIGKYANKYPSIPVSKYPSMQVLTYDASMWAAFKYASMQPFFLGNSCLAEENCYNSANIFFTWLTMNFPNYFFVNNGTMSY